MKKFAVIAVLVCELALGGCGGSNATTNTINATSSGLWSAVLAGGSGEGSGAVLGFTINFAVNGDGSLNVSQFSFDTTQTCFVSETESGTSTLTTDSAGTVQGSVTFVVTSNSPSGNTLTLTGTEDGSSITGDWALVGATGCSDGKGTFTMTK